MKFRIAAAPFINTVFLSTLITVFKTVREHYKYPNYTGRIGERWNVLLPELFQNFVSAIIAVIVIYGLYAILFRLFLKRSSILIRAFVFGVAMYLLFMLLLNTVVAFGPGPSGWLKTLPFAIMCFCLPITEHFFDLIIGKYINRNK